MKKAILLLCAICTCTALFFLNEKKETTTKKISGFDKAWRVSMGIGTKEDRYARFTHEYEQLVDPATGKLPPNIRAKELMFAKTLQNNAAARNASGSVEWEHKGPFNVGGRTRAFAIDVTDENVMLAGSVSGGIWKSVDAGASWYKVNTSGLNVAVTTIAQDPRPGHTNEWYYGTGELFGASQGAPGAFFLGNGLFKSTDSGEFWAPMTNTNSNTPQSFDSVWDGIWDIEIDPSSLDQTVIYVAAVTTIFRSGNGGGSWAAVLTPPNFDNASYFTDIAVSATGVVYAGKSRENEIISWGLSPTGGMWRSTNGTNWTNITPANFPPTYNRIVLDINPSDENEVYFLASNVDTLFGKTGTTPIQDDEHNALWRYNYISGNGSGEGGAWTDLSENIYAGPNDFDDFYAQGGYNLMVKVHPTSPSTVFIGGTNLFRSTDGFTTSDNVSYVGGYAVGTEWPTVESYPEHHSDQHGVAFLPSNPNVMYSYSDGGVARTDDCLAAQVNWTSLNNGYLSTQFYTVYVDQGNENETIMGGLQDNGTRYTNNSNPETDWTHPFGGDGAFGAIPGHGEFVITSIQQGRLFKVQLDAAGEMTAFERFDPALERSEFRFIHQFAIDPDDHDVLYYPIGNKLYVNMDVGQYDFTNSYDSTMVGWSIHVDTLPDADAFYTAISGTETPEHRVYLGTNTGKIYRIDDATDINATLNDVTTSLLPADANISCFAVDPTDSDKVMVVYTNYETYSIFYSRDAGTNWERAGGNLEALNSGAGSGPSVRWAEIMALPDGSRKYFAGTSIGLFSTDTLELASTNWIQESPEFIDNNIVSTMDVRHSDNFIAIGTHGNGVYSGYLIADSIAVSNNQNTYSPTVKVYPNPADDQLTIQLEFDDLENVRVQLYDLLGRKIESKVSKVQVAGSEKEIQLDVSALQAGNYYVMVEQGGFVKTLPVIIK